MSTHVFTNLFFNCAREKETNWSYMTAQCDKVYLIVQITVILISTFFSICNNFLHISKGYFSRRCAGYQDYRYFPLFVFPEVFRITIQRYNQQKPNSFLNWFHYLTNVKGNIIWQISEIDVSVVIRNAAFIRSLHCGSSSHLGSQYEHSLIRLVYMVESRKQYSYCTLSDLKQ